MKERLKRATNRGIERRKEEEEERKMKKTNRRRERREGEVGVRIGNRD